MPGTWGAFFSGKEPLAHRCGNTVPSRFASANRAAASKQACFSRHWRRFACFPTPRKKSTRAFRFALDPNDTKGRVCEPSPLDSPPRSWTVFKRRSAAAGGAWPAFPHLILWYYLHFPTILYNKGRMCRKAARKGACPLSRRVLPAGQSPSAPGKGQREDTAVHSWENAAWGTGSRTKPQAYAKEEPYT